MPALSGGVPAGPAPAPGSGSPPASFPEQNITGARGGRGGAQGGVSAPSADVLLLQSARPPVFCGAVGRPV